MLTKGVILENLQLHSFDDLMVDKMTRKVFVVTFPVISSVAAAIDSTALYAIFNDSEPSG